MVKDAINAERPMLEGSHHMDSLDIGNRESITTPYPRKVRPSTSETV
jgi:hypothetical protein